MKPRPGRRGEQDRRRRPFLTFPLPVAPSGVFSRGQSPAPRLTRRAPRGVLRAPSPAPAPRAAGPGGPGGPAAATAQRKLYTKQNPEPLERDCPGRSGPGRAENSLKGPRKRKRGGKRDRRRPGFGSAEETRVAAWLSDTSPAPPSVPRQPEPSAAGAAVQRRKGTGPLSRRHGSSLQCEWPWAGH